MTTIDALKEIAWQVGIEEFVDDENGQELINRMRGYINAGHEELGLDAIIIEYAEDATDEQIISAIKEYLKEENEEKVEVRLMITEDYCSFETTKLLKEKGFDGECRAFWKDWKGEIRLCGCNRAHMFDYCHNSMLERYNDTEETNIAAPTLQMAMKWLREVHHYYIQIMLDSWAYGSHSGYYVIIQKTNSEFEIMLADKTDKAFYDEPEEACEAAIKYCLENLI